ncbi:MAG: hypothetical protein M3Q64_01905 [bacterium]|nr:hypothetical protein [bacterium]
MLDLSFYSDELKALLIHLLETYDSTANASYENSLRWYAMARNNYKTPGARSNQEQVEIPFPVSAKETVLQALKNIPGYNCHSSTRRTIKGQFILVIIKDSPLTKDEFLIFLMLQLQQAEQSTKSASV